MPAVASPAPSVGPYLLVGTLGGAALAGAGLFLAASQGGSGCICSPFYVPIIALGGALGAILGFVVYQLAN